MKCVIIAAGQGTRLRDVAASKPLVPVRGIPLIEHIVTLARAGGASDFLVVTGYAPEPLEAFLAGLSDRAGIPIATIRNPDWTQPNGVSVLAADGSLTSDFLLLMSDHLFDPAIVGGLLETSHPAAALTLAVDYDLANPLVDLDDATKVAAGDGRILRVGKQIEDYNAFDTGIFRAGPGLFEALRSSLARGGSGSLSEGVQAMADAGRAYVSDIGRLWWVDVDDAAALRRAEETFPAALASG